jgi:hypothetical protein
LLEVILYMMREQAALRTLLQTSPTRARGLWSSVFFSIEVNPSTA